MLVLLLGLGNAQIDTRQRLTHVTFTAHFRRAERQDRRGLGQAVAGGEPKAERIEPRSDVRIEHRTTRDQQAQSRSHTPTHDPEQCAPDVEIQPSAQLGRERKQTMEESTNDAAL